MRQLTLAAFLLLLLVPVRATAQETLVLPIPADVIAAGPPPRPVMADGRLRLLYELRITNFGSKRPMELTRLEVLGDGVLIASYASEALDTLIMTVGPADQVSPARLVGAGRTVIVFLDLVLPPGQAAPRELRHRVFVLEPGVGRAEIVDQPSLAVTPAPPPVIRPPLRGAGWVAAFGLSDRNNHRRSLVTVDGRTWLSSRFAVDWVRLGRDGRFFDGDPSVNSSSYDYGAEVLAVGGGRVVGLKDGIPDNAGINRERAVPMTVDTIPGNSLILDLGHGVYAAYDHLQPRSFRVRLGQRVKPGEVLARLGNSGNAMAPHLHFQLMDRPAHITAEGVPYELDEFTQLGSAAGVRSLLTGQSWSAGSAAPVVHHREFPGDNAVVSFHPEPAEPR